MLIDFTVSNYQSIKKEQTFSFVSESKTKEENALFSIENKTIKLYPFSAIFGPNASGKSKFIYALEDLCKYVADSYKYGENQNISAYKPFLLDEESKDKSSRFEIEYEVNGSRFLYILEVLKKEVVYEELFSFSYNVRTAKTRVFTRKRNESIYFNKEYTSLRKGVEEFLLPNQSLLSRCGNSKNELLKLPYSFFSDKIKFYTHKSFELPEICKTTVLLDGDYQDFFKSQIINFLHSADMQIEDIKIEHNKDNKIIDYLRDASTDERNETLLNLLSAEPKIAHKVNSKTKENEYVYFDLASQESSGTNKLYDLSSYFLSSLISGETIVIDEFNTGLHPVIEKMIVDMYLDPEINVNHAQLLVTSHNTYILDACRLKREQVWFTDKNELGETELYCLNEFDKNLIRDYANYGKYYLEGRFNALPAISIPVLK